NDFVKRGIEVITERDHFVHVSGHPSIDELERMYKLTRPLIAVPVHGEPIHIHEHTKLAKKWGVKYSVELHNGLPVKLSEEGPELLPEVESGYLGIDGNYLIHADSEIVKMRLRMRDSGIVLVVIVLNRHGSLASDPILFFPGVLDKD